MTKLKDLPEGTLLIGVNGRKGLYSNDNAPIFVMELGGTKAKVLWQGTRRYDAFMNPLIKKEHGEGLKENVDYILPENVGMTLPTWKPTGIDYSSEDSEETLKDSRQYTLPTFSLDDSHFEIQGKDKTSDVDEVKSTDEEHPKDPILDDVEDTEPKFRVKISPDLYTEEPESYLNLEKHPGKEAPSGDVLKLDECSSLFMHDSIETNFSYSYLNLKFITSFTLPEYKNIRKQALKNPEYGNMHWTLPEYDPNNARFELVSGDSLPVDSSSTKGTKTLPNSVMVDLKSLELYITDLPEHLDALKQVVDKLVSYLGELDYGYWLFVSMHDLKVVLNDSSEEDYEDIRDRVHQVIAMAHEEL